MTKSHTVIATIILKIVIYSVLAENLQINATRVADHHDLPTNPMPSVPKRFFDKVNSKHIDQRSNDYDS
jgi:hypothetical protein